MQYAFWNDGSPRVLRSNKNVTLPDGTTVLEVVGPLPHAGLYRYHETPSAIAGHQQRAGLTFRLDGDAITASPVIVDRPVAELVGEKLAAIDAERDRRRYPGSIETGLGWSIDLRTEKDERNINGAAFDALAAKAAGVTDPVIVFRGADDVLRTLTADEVITAGRAVQAHISGVYATSWRLKDAVGALTSAAAVAAYDAGAGW